VPEFTLTGAAAAPVEEVWKLLFDPARYGEWWAGLHAVHLGSGGDFIMWLADEPDHPMPQRLRPDRACARVVMSCQDNGIDFTWQLAERGDGTQITARVVIPPQSAHLHDRARAMIAASLTALTALAESAAA
jgi:uncharacterized protein YndB with AHSA1/START domain